MKKEMKANELYHFGTKGMKWGVRRFQNPDGSLTEAGKSRYYSEIKDSYANRTTTTNPNTVNTANSLKQTKAFKDHEAEYNEYTEKCRNAAKVNSKIYDESRKSEETIKKVVEDQWNDWGKDIEDYNKDALADYILNDDGDQGDPDYDSILLGTYLRMPKNAELRKTYDKNVKIQNEYRKKREDVIKTIVNEALGSYSAKSINGNSSYNRMNVENFMNIWLDYGYDLI